MPCWLRVVSVMGSTRMYGLGQTIKGLDLSQLRRYGEALEGDMTMIADLETEQGKAVEARPRLRDWRSVERGTSRWILFPQAAIH